MASLLSSTMYEFGLSSIATSTAFVHKVVVDVGETVLSVDGG